jgi:methionyl-tRNA formyltransferase
MGIPLFQPDDVNHPEVIARLRALAPDLTILAGYGPIVKQEFIDCAPLGCINLHGGKLPQYRGSSPMNWALINGDCEFTLSIIRVDTGVDTGDVLIERTFPIGIDDTIADLQATANRAFPEMLLEVLSQIQNGTDRARKQESAEARYFPLRFPEDGLILWDLLTAEQVHNKIRALTDPYPGAFTYYQKRRVKLLRSTLMKGEFHGEPGRVYRKSIQGLLVCAMDRCLWIQRAYMEPDGGDLFDQIQRYDKLATVRDLAVAGLVRDGK